MSRKGFTLIELLIGMAISTMIGAVSVPTIYTLIQGTARNNSQVVSLTDVNQATVRIERDLQMAQTTSLVDGDSVPQISVTLTWTDFSGESTSEPVQHTSTYALTDTKLYRTYDGAQTLAAAHVSSLGFTRNGRLVTVTITSTAPEFPHRSETLVFKVYLRSEAVP